MSSRLGAGVVLAVGSTPAPRGQRGPAGAGRLSRAQRLVAAHPLARAPVEIRPPRPKGVAELLHLAREVHVLERGLHQRRGGGRCSPTATASSARPRRRDAPASRRALEVLGLVREHVAVLGHELVELFRVCSPRASASSIALRSLSMSFTRCSCAGRGSPVPVSSRGTARRAPPGAAGRGISSKGLPGPPSSASHSYRAGARHARCLSTAERPALPRGTERRRTGRGTASPVPGPTAVSSRRRTSSSVPSRRPRSRSSRRWSAHPAHHLVETTEPGRRLGFSRLRKASRRRRALPSTLSPRRSSARRTS